jgi:hypothetical protein
VITAKGDGTIYRCGICLYAFYVALIIRMLELHRRITIADIHNGGNPIEICLQWSQPEEDNCVHAIAHAGRSRRSVQKEGEILDTVHTNLYASIH